MKQKMTLFAFLFLLCAFVASAQTKTVAGKVTDSSGQPLVGVTVLVKGNTTLGTTTNVDGTYEIKGVPGNAILTFSSIGLKSRDLASQGLRELNATLEEDALNLDDVVVVGYGTAKLKDLTSPISNVKAEEIMKTPSSNAMQAIQGKVAGVQIVNNGAPGEGPTVRIRGVGTFYEKDGKAQDGPLYVVDGMFYDNINFLSSSDIESLSILKDASAAAIYGVRAANGVVLVTTKKGGINQKATVTYDGYVGVQKATNMMKMANSAQYANMMREVDNSSAVDNSIVLWGGANGVPATDTDWYEELTRNGRIQSHSIDVSGGSETATYSVGLNYFNQMGLLKYNSDYERFNIRAKGDYRPYKWLKIGANMIVSNSTQNIGNSDAWFKAFLMPSIVPVYDEKNAQATPIKFGDPQAIGLSNGYFSNPMATAYYNDKQLKSFHVLPSYYAEVSFLSDNRLNLRTSFAQDVTINRTRDYTPAYFVGSGQKSTDSKLVKSDDFYNNYIWDNTLTYNDNFGKHNLTAMIGQSIRNEDWRMLKGEAKNVSNLQPEYLYLNKGNKDTRVADDNGTTYRGASFFARMTYNYDSRYLLSATMRADGSSKYQEKWGYFPSVGIAWVMSNEQFMQSQRVFDYLKLRASWGKLGNDRVNASNGFSAIQNSTPAMGDVLIPGYIMQSNFSWLKWEVVTETNVGFEAAFLSNRLTADFDYYSRITDNGVVACPMPITGEYVQGNYGKIKNSGFELTLNWSDKIGADFRYNVGVNMTTLKNEVTKILRPGVPNLMVGSAEFRQIIVPGQPMNTFYGYKVAGIYQNAAEIAADPVAVAAGLKPGDVRFVNTNDDDVINDLDRQYIGSPLPTFTYGGNLGFEWKNIDFGVTFMGVYGNKIINRKMGTRSWVSDMNFSEEFAKHRWTGPGTSNKHPSVAGLMSSRVNGKLSELFIGDGAYFRIQNVQVGYTFQNIAPKGKEGAKLRLYISADRPYTAFNYNGFTPEIPNGIDMQTYPMAATYSFGVKITY